jgi:hypothetical protein
VAWHAPWLMLGRYIPFAACAEQTALCQDAHAHPVFLSQAGSHSMSSSDTWLTGCLCMSRVDTVGLCTCAGSVEKQLQGMKLNPAAPCSQRSSASSIPATVSPEPVAAEASGSSFVAANSAGSSSRPATAEQGSSSRDVTPPLTERSDRLQQSLRAVKRQIIELVSFHTMYLATSSGSCKGLIVTCVRIATSNGQNDRVWAPGQHGISARWSLI